MSAKYPKEDWQYDWQYEVWNGYTKLGYAEWACNRKESDRGPRGKPGARPWLGRILKDAIAEHKRSKLPNRTDDELAKDILRSLNRMLKLAPDAVHSVLTEFGHSVNVDLKDDPHLPLQADWGIQGMNVLNGLIHELTGRFVTPVYRDAEPVGFKFVPKRKR